MIVILKTCIFAGAGMLPLICASVGVATDFVWAKLSYFHWLWGFMTNVPLFPSQLFYLSAVFELEAPYYTIHSIVLFSMYTLHTVDTFLYLLILLLHSINIPDNTHIYICILVYI